jgi:hypothetical protein
MFLKAQEMGFERERIRDVIAMYHPTSLNDLLRRIINHAYEVCNISLSLPLALLLPPININWLTPVIIRFLHLHKIHCRALLGLPITVTKERAIEGEWSNKIPFKTPSQQLK